MVVAKKHSLIAARTQRGWSQKELAAQVRLSPSAISRIEAGRGVGEKSAAKISTALGGDVFQYFDIYSDTSDEIGGDSCGSTNALSRGCS